VNHNAKHTSVCDTNTYPIVRTWDTVAFDLTGETQEDDD